MKAEHTLGPWDVSKKFPTHIYKWIDGNTFRIVATCDSHGKDEQAQADARLIAAAPDLLAIVEEAFAQALPEENPDLYAKMRLAIAKAKGQ